MKTLDNPIIEDRPIAPPDNGLKIKLVIVVGWAIMTFLIAVSLAVQSAQAQAELGEPLPDSITVTRGVERGRKAISFHVNEPHSLFRYYDRIGTPWDRSGGSCYKNRVWFDYYMADYYDDTEPIRQSHSYTLHQREEDTKVCILVVFGDWRDGGGGANPNGPFSFDADQTLIIDPIEEQSEEKEVDETEQAQDQQTEDDQQPARASESEFASKDYRYPTSQPLITSRPIAAPPTESTEAGQDPQSPQPQPETGADPDLQADQSQPVDKPGAPDATVDNPQLIEAEIAIDRVDEVVAGTLQEAAQTDQASDDSSTNSNLRNTRAVLWGIVAAMATLLILGSFIFRSKDRS